MFHTQDVKKYFPNIFSAPDFLQKNSFSLKKCRLCTQADCTAFTTYEMVVKNL